MQRNIFYRTYIFMRHFWLPKQLLIFTFFLLLFNGLLSFENHRLAVWYRCATLPADTILRDLLGKPQEKLRPYIPPSNLVAWPLKKYRFFLRLLLLPYYLILYYIYLLSISCFYKSNCISMFIVNLIRARKRE